MHFRRAAVLNWDKLSDEEKGNVNRATTEIGILAGTFLALNTHIVTPPDDERPGWLSQMATYQLYKLRSELSSLAPTPSLVNEGLRVLESPFAAMRTIQNTINLIDAMMPWHLIGENSIIKSGKYAGHRKIYRALYNAPIFSMWKTIGKAFDQSDMIEYYKNDYVM